MPKEKELETRRIMEDLEAQKAEFEQNLPPGQKLLQVPFFRKVQKSLTSLQFGILLTKLQ